MVDHEDDYIDNNGGIPRPEAYYRFLPAFDPSLTFADNNRHELRHILNPLDEAYSTELWDHYQNGSLPPEEVEVRDVLLATVYLRSKAQKVGFWRSLFSKPTEAVSAAKNMQKRLESLVNKSPEHRAAFCRLANGEALVPGLRKELRGMIDMADAHRQS